MTCDHCVTAAVRNDELGSLDGVTGVAVDLRPARHCRVTVTSVAPLPDRSVAAAVDEAGYELVADDERDGGHRTADAPATSGPDMTSGSKRSRQRSTSSIDLDISG